MIDKVDHVANIVALGNEINYNYVYKLIDKDFDTPNYILFEVHMQKYKGSKFYWHITQN